MFFHTSIHNTILFEQWHTMTWEELLGSCIGIAIIAALYEGFKVGREYLDLRMLKADEKSRRQDDEQPGGCVCSAADGSVGSSTQTNADSSTVIAIESAHDTKQHAEKRRPAIISLRHIAQTGLHFVQLWIGFCLMLIFMTYSVYLCLAITVGGAVGYFCFAWMRPAPLHHATFSGVSTVDCCN